MLVARINVVYEVVRASVDEYKIWFVLVRKLRGVVDL